MSRKEKFMKLLNKHGYSSLNNFCIENKLQQSHFNNRLNNESLKVDLLILFKLANILEEPIDILIEIFYPDEYKDNQRHCKK
jgi:hypothetical protein